MRHHTRVAVGGKIIGCTPTNVSNFGVGHPAWVTQGPEVEFRVVAGAFSVAFPERGP